MWMILFISIATSVTGQDQPESDTALVFIDVPHSEIFRMDLNTSRVTSIPVTNLENPVAIDLDPSEDLMFWTDVVGHTIKRSTLTGDNETVIKYLSSIAVPDGLAVDWKAKLLIYTDTGEDKIVKMDYNGGGEVTIVTSVDEPRAVALDYDSRTMYWTDWGHDPKIEVATYDGNDRRAVVESTDIVWPNGLTLNRAEQILYWCDGNLGRVESIKIDGTDRKLLTISPGSHFFGIVYFEEYLYTTSWSSSSIQKMHKSGDTLLNIGDPFLIRAYGITAYRRVNVDTTPSASTNPTSASEDGKPEATQEPPASTNSTSVSEDGKPEATQEPAAGNKSDQIKSVHTNLIIILAVVASASVTTNEPIRFV